MKFSVSICTVVLCFAVTVSFAQEKPVSGDVYFFGPQQPAVVRLPVPDYPDE